MLDISYTFLKKWLCFGVAPNLSLRCARTHLVVGVKISMGLSQFYVSLS